MTITVPENNPPTRLDVYLAQTQPHRSRSHWQKTIENNLITVNGKTVTKHTVVQPGDVIIEHHHKPTPEPNLTPPHIPIIAEENDYVIIDKPAGIITHTPTETAGRPSVAAWAIAHRPAIARVGDNPALRPGIAHRLDRDVSGVMVIAKTQRFYDHLKQQFAHRTVQKEYLALVHGRGLDDEFDIAFRLTRNKKTGKMSALPPTGDAGKEALTHIEVKERFTNATLLSIYPKTGRMHQIRAHLFAYGAPIVGDTLYTSKKFPTSLDDTLRRIFLHAYRISFIDLENKPQTYTAPLPKALESFLKNLKIHNKH